MLLQAAAELAPHASERRSYSAITSLGLHPESLQAKQVLCQLRATGNLRAASLAELYEEGALYSHCFSARGACCWDSEEEVAESVEQHMHPPFLGAAERQQALKALLLLH